MNKQAEEGTLRARPEEPERGGWFRGMDPMGRETCQNSRKGESQPWRARRVLSREPRGGPTHQKPRRGGCL